MHEFALVLADWADFEEACERLFDAGCDDATPVLAGGTIRLEFDREAPSFREAVTSAIREAEVAGTRVERVETDRLVTASDIARRTDRTREVIRLYARGERGPGGFPSPVVGHHYDWPAVAAWFREHGLHEAEFDPRDAEIAAVNHLLDLRRLVRSQRDLVERWRELQPTS